MFTAEHSPYNSGPLDASLSGVDLALFEEVAEQTAAIFTALGNGSESFGLFHNDFILGNCHPVRRRPHSWDIGVLDFDECGWAAEPMHTARTATKRAVITLMTALILYILFCGA